MRHSITIGSTGQAFSLDAERIEASELREPGHLHVDSCYQSNGAEWLIKFPLEKLLRSIPKESLELHRSILAQRRDPDFYPELAWLAQNYEKVRIYREWAFGRNAVFREPQRADMRNDRLASSERDERSRASPNSTPPIPLRW